MLWHRSFTFLRFCCILILVRNMLRIIYEDNDVIAVIKPVGIDSEKEMVERLKTHTSSDYIAVLHRLDTAVSGVMVYAKNKAAAANL